DVRRWDKEKLTLYLDEVTAERVRCIPLADHLRKDMIVWGEESSGVFIVRSGYKILMH
ncbi:hypothetical protein Gohar_026692, partial [Gossypium harknessii]|nr:hypothetical protein [Gossypium harknessii]